MKYSVNEILDILDKEFDILEESVSNDMLNKIKEFNNELNSWDYGVFINGKVETDVSKIDWSKYKTIPINLMEKYHVGICWDFVNYEWKWFKEHKIPCDAYFFVMQKSKKPDDIVTHTFIIFKNNSKKYWFESSWSSHQGIKEVKGYEDVCKELVEKYGDHSYSVFKYNPNGLDKNIKNGDFFDRASKNLIKDVSIEESSEITESVIFSKKDAEFNLSSWNPNGKNILFITGLSGSGKSTKASKLAKERNAVNIELDLVEHNDILFDDSVTQDEGNQILKEFFIKKFGGPKKLESKTMKVADIMYEAIKYCMDYANKHKGKLFIAEGIQIMDLEMVDELKGYPVIVVNTSIAKSISQAKKREEGSSWKEFFGSWQSFKEYCTWYFGMEKNKNKFIKDMKESGDDYLINYIKEYAQFDDSSDIQYFAKVVTSNMDYRWTDSLLLSYFKKIGLIDGLKKIKYNDDNKFIINDLEGEPSIKFDPVYNRFKLLLFRMPFNIYYNGDGKDPVNTCKDISYEIHSWLNEKYSDDFISFDTDFMDGPFRDIKNTKDWYERYLLLNDKKGIVEKPSIDECINAGNCSVYALINPSFFRLCYQLSINDKDIDNIEINNRYEQPESERKIIDGFYKLIQDKILENKYYNESSKDDINYIAIEVSSKDADKYINKDSLSKKNKDYLKDNTGEILVDKDTDDIIGYVWVGKSKDKGFISTLIVKKKYRGKGFGKILLNDAIKKFGAVDLVVHKDNKIAYNMYKKAGFKVVKDVDHEGKDSYWMKLK